MELYRFFVDMIMNIRPCAAILRVSSCRECEAVHFGLEQYYTEQRHRYGYTFEDAMKDPFVLVNKAASETTSTATVPGTFLVDTFPIRERNISSFSLLCSYNLDPDDLVKHVPEWMPGAGFKKIAREWRILQEAVVNRPFDMVRDQHVRPHSVAYIYRVIVILSSRKA